MAETASIAELKKCLSAYLKHVKAGEEVVITERGNIIARIVPYTRSGATPAEYEAMIKSGQIRPGTGTLGPEFWDQPRIADPDGLVLKALLDERESGW